MNVVVIGADGQLGSDVVSAFSAAGDAVTAIARPTAAAATSNAPEKLYKTRTIHPTRVEKRP